MKDILKIVKVGKNIFGHCAYYKDESLKYLNKKEGVEYNPYLYGLYTLLFGYLFSVFMYYGKLNKERYGENNKSSFIFYFIAYIIVAINIVYIFTCIN